MKTNREDPTLFDYTRTEVVAGGFVLLGLAVLGYLSISIGGLRILPRDDYRVSARFSNVGDLKLRAPVKVAGVTVGQVKSIRLADYYGEVELAIARKVTLPKDTIASIATAGLLGDAYVSLSPGGADANLGDGDRITRTEPALNMADIIGRYAFGGQQSPAPASGDDKKEPSR
jgi:phospholipid/cholesterol/gamma-HCH transport system substrate-binding protein